jgi:HPt (histidine-containing phosphotransfer) domain-containing protein
MYLNTEHAVEQFGDVETLVPMLTMLEESLARDIGQIAEFLGAEDVAAANRLLHPMKGFLPLFCREALCEELGAVEMMSKNGSVAEVTPAYAALQPKLEQLLVEVSAFLKSNGVSP